jgi:hypothetical protein
MCVSVGSFLPMYIGATIHLLLLVMQARVSILVTLASNDKLGSEENIWTEEK